MARKPFDISVSELTEDVALATFEIVQNDPRESGQLLWRLYERFKKGKIEHILDPRVGAGQGSLFLKLIDTEGMDHLSGKRQDAIMDFVRSDPVLSEKYLNSHQKPRLPSPRLN